MFPEAQYPESIDRFKIVRVLGRGGMGVVYLARDEELDREVALKVIKRDLLGDQEISSRFRREAKTVARLEHPGIVPIYEYGEFAEQPFFVMRYFTGGSLKEQLPVSAKAALEILKHLSPAIDLAHSKNIIHRDLKPENILLDGDGRPFISDFGIAKLVALSGPRESSTVGTPPYMSPEQFNSDTLDYRSDIYSLGVILFEMLTGKLPFTATTPARIMHLHLHAQVPRLDELRENIPEAIQEVINKALAKKAEERFQTATEMVEAYASAIGSLIDTKETHKPYRVLATAETPALILFLIDNSASMSLPLGSRRRVDVVVEGVRTALHQMVFRSTKGKIISQRYRVGIFLYNDSVEDVFGGVLGIDEVAKRVLPEITPSGRTDTTLGLIAVEKQLLELLPALHASPAALVCHLTDGMFTGEDPEPIARRIMNLRVRDGRTLITNIYLTDEYKEVSGKTPREWGGITDETQLDPSQYLHKLRRMSSKIPASYRKMMADDGYQIRKNAYMLLPGDSPELLAMGIQMASSTPVRRLT